MINLGRLVHSRHFAQQGGFTVHREGGAWDHGRWVSSEQAIQMQGIAIPAGPKDLVQVPEGDRATGVMCFYSTEQIYTTRTSDRSQADGTSDQIEWNGDRYRVSSVTPWSDFGYYKALALRMVGV